jgi:hypothetical protein
MCSVTADKRTEIVEQIFEGTELSQSNSIGQSANSGKPRYVSLKEGGREEVPGS